MIFEIPIKISKLTKITGALNHTYPELSVARATLVFVDGIPKLLSNFRMVPVRQFMTPIDQQVSEGLMISNSEVDILMNSGSEWRTGRLPRAAVTSQKMKESLVNEMFENLSRRLLKIFQQ